MQIKVLNILEDARGGGITNRVVEVATNLKKTDIETLVLFPKKNSENFKQKLLENDIDFLQIELSHLTYEFWGLLKYIFNFLFEIYAICKIIKDKKIDIIHCNGAWQFKGIIAAYLTPAKSAWHLNDTYQNGIILAIFKVLSTLSDSFIVASERTKQYYLKTADITKKPMEIIEAPINFNGINNSKERFDLIDTYDGFKVVTVGHINPNKGIETLVETAFEAKQKSNFNINFFIIGKVFSSQKKYFQKINDLIEEHKLNNIHFLGYQNNIASILHSADIYLCTSDNESSPISVWEGMASGKAIVSTDVGDVREIFELYDCGLVANVRDPKKLADHLLTLIKDKELRKSFGYRGQKTAKKLFDIHKIAAKYSAFYHKLS